MDFLLSPPPPDLKQPLPWQQQEPQQQRQRQRQDDDAWMQQSFETQQQSQVEKPPPPPLVGFASKVSALSRGMMGEDTTKILSAPPISVADTVAAAPSLQSRLQTKFGFLQRNDIAEVRDAPAMTVVFFVRVLRVMFLWIIFYFVDRAYQGMYVDNVMSTDGKADTPVSELNPRLWTMILAVFAIEFVFLMVVFLVLWSIKKRFKSANNSFLLDDALMRRIITSYVGTLVVLVPMGMLFGHVMQSCKDLRYRDDGLRGIRALAILLLLTCTIVVLAV